MSFNFLVTIATAMLSGLKLFDEVEGCDGRLNYGFIVKAVWV